MFPQSSGTSSSSNIRSIAFVDSGISDANSLIAGLSEHHVIQLSTETNGIEEITKTLSKHQNLESIHVFSHGENGSLQLGNALLSQAFLSEYQNDLQSWGQALIGKGDLLFYGCDFAADGTHFIEQISQATGADIAASNDVTGKDGDWQLEVTTGSIEATIALDQATQMSYQGQLNLLTNGSFEANAVDNDSWAIFDASAVAGWQSLNGERIEVWDSGHNGVLSTDGSNHIELDHRGSRTIDAIYQNVQTQAGQTYTLSFDVRSRGANFNSDDESVVVEWNGVKTKVDGYKASAAGQWSTITTSVVGTGSDRILFRESGTIGASDGTGPLLDNISLTLGQTNNPPSTPNPGSPNPGNPANLVVNGSFETASSDAQENAQGEVTTLSGWQLNNGGVAVRNSGFEGVTSSVGTKHLDIDYRTAVDGVSQWIQTEAGVAYDLIFDIYATRPDVASDDQAIVVTWNGLKIGPDQSGLNATTAEAWETIRQRVIGTGGQDELLFRESGTREASDGVGALIDNVIVSRVGEPTAANGSGFTSEAIVTGLDTPTAFAYADDGRIFVAEKAGRVKVIQNGQVTGTFIDINQEVNSYWDRGLVGIALDPDFSTNGWVYLNYTVDLDLQNPDLEDFGSTAGGRLVRVQASSDNSNIADLSTREVILDGHQMVNATHTVGDVDFDNQGNLVFSWGDGGFSDDLRLAAQDPDSKQGKFFRVDPNTGFGLPNNPFYDPANPDSTRSKVLALGVRNPWRWSVDRATGDIYFGEVTDGGPEEVNIISATITNPDKQLNFGWPHFEGLGRSRHPVPSTVDLSTFTFQEPYVALPHAGDYDAVTGGAVYRGTAYPEIYNDRYFFANVGQNTFYTADANGDFAQFGNAGAFNSPVDIQFALDGSIQYLSMFDGGLYRLTYDADNNQALIPNALADVSVSAGVGPLTVNFSGSGSSAPNGDALSYAWDFNSDGSTDSTAANPQHTYTSIGKQIATLTVTDTLGITDSTIVEVTVNSNQPNDNNLAVGKPTSQSSTLSGGLASRAVDGNTNTNFANGSVTSTTLEDKAFWEIDLGAVYDLSSVQLFIGNQPLSNYYVLGSDNELASGNLSALLSESGVWHYNDTSIVTGQTTVLINQSGRYLRVQLAETGFVSLAEVKVFGTLPDGSGGSDGDTPDVVNFNQTSLTSYASQDQNSTVNISSNGSELRIQGNGWKKINFPYIVTQNSILEFEFRSDREGEVYGIGLDTNNGISMDRVFRLSGTQANGGGITAFDNYVTGSGWKTYRIPVGDFFTGDFSFLTFINDHDVSNPTGASRFRNIRMSES